jgi:prepilin-type N-terminal cleavage/methylation domain-containing protein
MNRRRSAASAGFTLIEVMISLFFLAFIVVELANVSTYARRSTAYARRLTEANMLAEAVLEKSRNTAWNNLNNLFSGASSIKFDSDRNGTLESYNETYVTPPPAATVVTNCTVGVYTVTRTMRWFLPSTATMFSQLTAMDIAVTVKWKNTKGADEQISITTVRAKS